MNTPPDPHRDADDLDRAWRDTPAAIGPSPTVRAAIFAEAARVAQAARAAQGAGASAEAAVAAHDRPWRLKAAAAIAVLGLIGLITQQALRWRAREPISTPATAPLPAGATATRVASAPPPATDATGAADATGALAAGAADTASLPPAPAAQPARSAERSPRAGSDWAQHTEMLLRAVLARHAIPEGTVDVHCDADRCGLAGDAAVLNAVVQAPELAGRLRLATSAPAAATTGTVTARVATQAATAAASAAETGAPGVGAPAGRVRYTLLRVSGRKGASP
ncbi:MAG: hypothetical protein IT480_16210 [Gammaproteobacteria bacterium]|nr:hypothetical protein [Gammaproteobacteria bacterium]